ncbi:MAG: Ig-like domain-containing protein [Gemmatimonadota bacterium]|nr:Ig-like domain-containing protein [Gemmatimonadota bacterium]
MMRMHVSNISIWLIAFAVACTRSATAPAEVLTATIEPPVRATVKCATIQLAVAVRNAAGNAITPDSVKWTSGDATVASISSSGLLRALKAPAGVTIAAIAYVASRQVTASALIAIGDPLVYPPPTCSAE